MTRSYIFSTGDFDFLRDETEDRRLFPLNWEQRYTEQAQRVRDRMFLGAMVGPTLTSVTVNAPAPMPPLKDMIAGWKKLIGDTPPPPFFASSRQFVTDDSKAISFEHDRRKYFAAHPDFWAKIPGANPQGDSNPFAAIPIHDLDTHQAARDEFYEAMAAAVELNPALASDGKEYAVIANVIEIDKVFRRGAKVLVVGNPNGMAERIQVRGLSRGGRVITKYCAYKKLDKFRAAWQHEALRNDICMLGTREEMEAHAAGFQEAAERERAAHPNRRGQV